jgi:hypothetical protein
VTGGGTLACSKYEGIVQEATSLLA